MCNEWGFTIENEKTIAEFFDLDISNIYKRIRNLKKLDIVKTVEYNGRSGFMINPLYCYQGALHLRRFRVKLWEQEKIYSSSRPDRFYGPPLAFDRNYAKGVAALPPAGSKSREKPKSVHPKR